MKEKIKAAILQIIALLSKAATIVSGILILQALVLLSGIIPGLDLVALFGDKVTYYADLIGVAAGYGILQWLKTIDWFKAILSP